MILDAWKVCKDASLVVVEMSCAMKSALNF